jgi:glutathione S-transferase
MSITMYDLTGADEGRRFSPYCWRARMALAHKQLDHEARPVRFLDIPSICGGGQKTVPVIEDGGKVVADSWAIAEYLEQTYPDRPSLFGGEGGRAACRFIDGWVGAVVQSGLFPMVALDIHDHLDAANQPYFREDREKRLGRTMEEAQAGREQAVEGFRRNLQPLRLMLKAQPFIGGQGPLYGDYLVFGAFMWAASISEFRVLAADDPICDWLERCRNLHGGLARNFGFYY